MNVLKLKATLAGLAMREWQLAMKLGMRPSTFSAYLRGSRNAPPDLEKRIERELRLKPGALQDPPSGGPARAA